MESYYWRSLLKCIIYICKSNLGGVTIYWKVASTCLEDLSLTACTMLEGPMHVSGGQE